MSVTEKGHLAPLKNVGRLECGVRVLAGLWLTAHAIDAAAAARPYLAIAWAAVGLFVLVTGLLRICPVYTLIGTLRPHAAARPR
jgi:hypothetical protein